MGNYLILTDDRKITGSFTRWAEVPKEDIAFLKKVVEYLKTSNKPERFLIYDTEKNTVHRMIDCRFIEIHGGDKNE